MNQVNLTGTELLQLIDPSKPLSNGFMVINSSYNYKPKERKPFILSDSALQKFLNRKIPFGKYKGVKT